MPLQRDFIEKIRGSHGMERLKIANNDNGKISIQKQDFYAKLIKLNEFNKTEDSCNVRFMLFFTFKK